MICVIDVKVVDVNINQYRLAHLNNEQFYKVRGASDQCSIEAIEEVIHGDEFVDTNGRRIRIGMSNMVQTAIGLPFRAFRDMSWRMEVATLTISQLRSRSARYQKRIEELTKVSYFKRLWYAIIGKIM